MTEKQIKKFISNHNDLDGIIKDYTEEEYQNLIKKTEEILSENYNNKNIAVDELFLGDYCIEELTFGNYLTYLVLILPFQKHKIPFNIDFFVDVKNVYSLNDYYNKIIQFFTIEKNIDITDDIKEISDELTIFASKNYLVKSGTSICLYDMIKLKEKNKDIEEAMNFKVEEGKIIDPQKLSKQQDDNLKKMVNAIMNEEDNPFKTYIKSGAGINTNQFGELFCYIGYKPDFFGKVIPRPVNTSFVRGLNVSEYFINACGARKAITTAKNQVRSSGYLNRKLGLLTSDCRIKDYNTNHDCGTKHTIPVFIDSQNTLNRFNNRYIVDENGKLKIIYDTDKDLIGTTINLRSPITCAEENEQICPICYGRLSRVNKNKNIGTIATLILCNPLDLIAEALISNN